MADLDSRLHAFRPDLADAKLQGRVDAKGFVEGVAMEVIMPVAALHREPSTSAMQTTQALLGERLMAFEVAGDWVWAQLTRDGYVGYISRTAVSSDLTNPTHQVSVPSTFLYPLPDIKSQPPVSLPMNARLEIVESAEKFRSSQRAPVFTNHIRPLNEAEADFVGVAENFSMSPIIGAEKLRGAWIVPPRANRARSLRGFFAARYRYAGTQLGQSLLITISMAAPCDLCSGKVMWELWSTRKPCSTPMVTT